MSNTHSASAPSPEPAARPVRRRTGWLLPTLGYAFVLAVLLGYAWYVWALCSFAQAMRNLPG